MKVRELIERLRACDPEAEVVIRNEDGDGLNAIWFALGADGVTEGRWHGPSHVFWAADEHKGLLRQDEFDAAVPAVEIR